MTFQAVQGGVEVVMHQTYLGHNVANVLHFRHEGAAPTIFQLGDLASSLWVMCGAYLKGLCASTWSLIDITATDISSEFGLQSIYRPSSPMQGTLGAGLPGNVAGVVSLKTAYRGRSYRGRIYLSGIPESQVFGNDFLSSWVSGALDWATQLLGLGSGFADLAVCSRWHDGVKRTVGVVTPVNMVTVNANVDTQRRRMI